MKKVIINASIFIVTICIQKSFGQSFTFVGEDAGKYALNKSNTGVGYRALYSDPSNFCSPAESCAFGNNALRNAECGSWNCAIGFESMLNTIGGYSNSAVGHQSLYENISGDNNSAFGYGSLKYNNNANDNSGFGYLTLFANTDGEFNTAIGSSALRNSKASNNTALGYNSAYYTTTGFSNLSLGVNSLYINTTGYYNTAVGNSALYANTTGYYNIATGPYALGKNTTGRYNIAIGFNAGNALISGSNNNTFIGTQADATVQLSNSTAIGNGAKVNASNKVRIGNSSVTVIGGAVNWSITTAPAPFITNKKENVPGVLFINKLKPITFNVDEERFAKFLGMADSVSDTEKKLYSIASNKICSGLMPEEVEKTAKEIGYDFNGIKVPQNEKDNYSIAYADFVPSLVKAVQELSQKNDEKTILLNEQHKINEALDKKIEKLEALLVAMQNGKNTSTSNSSDYALIPVTSSLQQNQPNPFSQNTIIKYSIPQQTKSAIIKITAANGVQVKSIALTQKDKGQISIDGGSFAVGIYYASLFVDGKKAETKILELIK